jgi:hypothetical protein
MSQSTHVFAQPRRAIEKVRAERAPRLHARRLALAIVALAMASTAELGLAMADPASNRSTQCEVATPQEAVSLADSLFARGEYQQAGACYEAAGNLERANEAFARAARPRSEETGRTVVKQRDAAKSLLDGVQKAFR